MQGLSDGYFILPYTLSNYLAGVSPIEGKITDTPGFKEAEAKETQKIKRLLTIKGKRTVDDFHRELGILLWNKCGMARSQKGLEEALKKIPAIQKEFWENVTVTGSGDDLNQTLEKAGRVADYLEFAELLVKDALHRKESCGGHFRTESQTPEGEAKRDDQNFCYVAAWQFTGADSEPVLHKEPLTFENVHLAQRNYK
jgi:succinate dehydrogenase / fumarate reductase flavoprotein subunit